MACTKTLEEICAEFDDCSRQIGEKAFYTFASRLLCALVSGGGGGGGGLSAVGSTQQVQIVSTPAWEYYVQSGAGWRETNLSDNDCSYAAAAFTPFTGGPHAITVSPDRTEVWGLTGAANDTITALEKADLATGAFISSVATSGIPANMHIAAMDIDPITGNLVAIGKDGVNVFNFYQVDDTTGAFTLLGSTSFLGGANVFGMGFAPDGSLYIGYQNTANTAARVSLIDRTTYALIGHVLFDVASGTGDNVSVNSEGNIIVNDGDVYTPSGDLVFSCAGSFGAPSDTFIVSPLGIQEGEIYNRVYDLTGGTFTDFDCEGNTVDLSAYTVSCVSCCGGGSGEAAGASEANFDQASTDFSVFTDAVSYFTLLTATGQPKKILKVFNNLNQDIYLSFNGTADQVLVRSGTELILDLGASGLAVSTDLTARAVVQPLSGNVDVTLIG